MSNEGLAGGLCGSGSMVARVTFILIFAYRIDSGRGF